MVVPECVSKRTTPVGAERARVQRIKACSKFLGEGWGEEHAKPSTASVKNCCGPRTTLFYSEYYRYD